ncbi:unnamed protein product [Rhizoctonia solani]|uniref:Uncharacterized protein n=1 Tax=Rhizoctonia solani TaxID=456999 RepID=A0A8H3DZR0_9AGAM|nr:unnamed protein product [Rhizoctonia solani]
MLHNKDAAGPDPERKNKTHRRRYRLTVGRSRARAADPPLGARLGGQVSLSSVCGLRPIACPARCPSLATYPLTYRERGPDLTIEALATQRTREGSGAGHFAE